MDKELNNKTLKIKLFDDYIMVRELEKEEKSIGGIIVAEYNLPHPLGEAEVIQVGPGKDDDPIKVKPGDKVYFNPHVGNDLLVDGKQCIIMRQNAVIATFETKPKITITKG